MANRHLSRSVVLQSLFERDFNGPLAMPIREILERNAAEFAAGVSDLSFMEELSDNILSKQEILDQIIEKAAPEWPIERISIVDRNILRLGLYELLFGDRLEVPPKVAINEAIELAKSFGGENSGKFVNGVLGAVYKELGEPGKDQTSKKKEKIDLTKLPVEKLIGAVVYARKDGELYLALVHDIFGHWTLSKGHLKEGESEEEAVKRKVMEEMGALVEPREKLGDNEYISNNADKTGKLRKHVSYYTAEAKLGKLTSEKGGGLDDAKWFKAAEIVDLNIYDDILPIITRAIHLLVKI